MSQGSSNYTRDREHNRNGNEHYLYAQTKDSPSAYTSQTTSAAYSCSTSLEVP
jgi:hypothetical protein